MIHTCITKELMQFGLKKKFAVKIQFSRLVIYMNSTIGLNKYSR